MRNCPTLALPKLCWRTCIALAWGAAGATAFGADRSWLTYSNPDYGFSIQYPSATHPEALPDKETTLVARVAFDFEQSFAKGQDSGSIKFRFYISVWRNANQLTADAWAKANTNSKLRSAIRPMRVGNRKAIGLKTNNLAWSSVKVFVCEKDSIYELSYTDVASNEILSRSLRSRWAGVFNRMLGSFTLLPNSESK